MRKILRFTIGVFCLVAAGLSLLIVCVTPFSGMPATPHRASGGVVIGYHRELTARNMDSLRYYPIVEYRDALGMTQEFRSYSPSLKPTMATGTVVSVFYEPNDNPKLRHAEIVNRESIPAVIAWYPWVLTMAALVLLVPFALVGYTLLNGGRG